MLIGLTGKKQSGKTTVADYLCSYHNFSRFGFADPLKDICGLLYPGLDFWEEKGKEDTDNVYGLSRREILQEVGTNVFREHYREDIWVDIMKYDIEKYFHENTVIHDVRFNNEAIMIKDQGGQIWSIKRPSEVSIDAHQSEQGIGLTPDIRIINDENIDKLYNAIELIIKSYTQSEIPINIDLDKVNDIR